MTAAARSVMREIRLSLACASSGKKLNQSPIASYIMEQYRRHQVTQKQHCKATMEMTYLADTYRTYLESQRKWRVVHDEYHAKGERSVAETAKLVGFKLPHDPK